MCVGVYCSCLWSVAIFNILLTCNYSFKTSNKRLCEGSRTNKKANTNFTHILKIIVKTCQIEMFQIDNKFEFFLMSGNDFKTMILDRLKTSPPSALVAAMRSMQNKLHNKTSLNFLKTRLTLSLNTL